jgi:hypothetical protein
MFQLSRKFKAPRAADAAQWAKVEFLVAHGFSFYSVYERIGVGERRVQYPETLAEAREFVKGRKREANSMSRLPSESSYGLHDLPVLVHSRKPAA